MEVTENHPLNLVRNEGVWQFIGAGEARMAEALKKGEHPLDLQKAFRGFEERYCLLANNMSEIVWVTDMKLKPIYISPSVTRLLGFGVDEAMSGTIDSMLSASSRQNAAETFSRALSLEGREPGKAPGMGIIELEFRRSDGSTVWAETTASFLRDSHGKPVQILGIVRDISERRRTEEKLRRSLDVLERTLEGAVEAISSILENKDMYTAGHQRRVTQLACAIAQEMGLPAERRRVIRIAGLLHDLGKIALPTDILTKPGALSDLELAVIRTHPQVAYDILKNIETFDEIAEVVLQHHERMDGSGYPRSLPGSRILLEARILAVSDVVEAMSSYRPYRAALGLDKALEEISSHSGQLYDADVVQTCLSILRQPGFEFNAL